MRSHWVIAVVIVAVATAGAAYAVATHPSAQIRAKIKEILRDVPPPDPSTWPNDSATIAAPKVEYPEKFGVYRVFIDPGHGAKGNTGNLSSSCEDEQAFTLTLAQELAAYLKGTKHFQVQLSRPDDGLVQYPVRVKRANAWGAHVFLSLHSDVRGQTDGWSRDSGTCPKSEDAPGFSVLWTDEGGGELMKGRHGLARSMAAAMQRAGFLAYDGAEYRDLYEADPTAAGVFVDRHAPGKRIFVLRKTKMPSVIVETHNAWDPREVRRWAGMETRQVFFATVEAALVDHLEAKME